MPWRDVCKPLIHQLIDLISRLACKFTTARKLDACDPPNLFRAGSDIVSRCWELETSLRYSYTKFKNTIAGPPYWNMHSTDAYKVVDIEYNTLLPTSFHFAHLSDAYVLMMY